MTAKNKRNHKCSNLHCPNASRVKDGRFCRSCRDRIRRLVLLMDRPVMMGCVAEALERWKDGVRYKPFTRRPLSKKLAEWERARKEAV